MILQLLDAHDTLTPADHQTHRRYVFGVPPDCDQLRIRVRYVPKRLDEHESARLAEAAVAQQVVELAARLGPDPDPDLEVALDLNLNLTKRLAEQWLADLGERARPGRLANLLTLSLDDASGAYRGAGHRHAHDQQLVLGRAAASPGLVAGELPPGAWTLTMSVHTLVSAQCELSIQIDAVIASSR